MTVHREQATLLALTETATGTKLHWYDIADLVETAGSVSALVDGTVTLYDEREIAIANELREGTSETQVDAWSDTLERVLPDGVTELLTVLDPEYHAGRPAELGPPPTQPYFNSGVLLFNLVMMRSDNCTENILSVALHENLL